MKVFSVATILVLFYGVVHPLRLTNDEAGNEVDAVNSPSPAGAPGNLPRVNTPEVWRNIIAKAVDDADTNAHKSVDLNEFKTAMKAAGFNDDVIKKMTDGASEQGIVPPYSVDMVLDQVNKVVNWIGQKSVEKEGEDVKKDEQSDDKKDKEEVKDGGESAGDVEKDNLQWTLATFDTQTVDLSDLQVALEFRKNHIAAAKAAAEKKKEDDKKK